MMHRPADPAGESKIVGELAQTVADRQRAGTPFVQERGLEGAFGEMRVEHHQQSREVKVVLRTARVFAQTDHREERRVNDQRASVFRDVDEALVQASAGARLDEHEADVLVLRQKRCCVAHLSLSVNTMKSADLQADSSNVYASQKQSRSSRFTFLCVKHVRKCKTCNLHI